MNSKCYCGALDIGSRYITFIIGKVERKSLSLIGHMRVPSVGVLKAQIEDMRGLTQVLGDFFESTSQRYTVLPDTLSLSESGSHLRNMRYESSLQLKGFQHIITMSDVEKVNRLALTKELPASDVFLHHARQFYALNGAVVDNPVGHVAGQLDVCYNALIGNAQRIKEQLYSVNQFGFKVRNLVFSGIASALATTTPVEREQGVCVVNIGDQVTEFVVYKHQIPVSMGIIPVGGKNFTYDLCSGLRIHFDDAERLKLEHGIPSMNLGEQETDVWVVGNRTIGDKRVKLKNFRTIIQARAQELFDYIYKFVKSDLGETEFLTGTILTGGGALLKNIEKTAAQTFHCDCSVRGPLAEVDNTLKSPIYSTCFGLLHYALQQPIVPQKTSNSMWKKITALFRENKTV